MLKDAIAIIVISALLSLSGFLLYDKYFIRPVQDITKQLAEKQKELDTKIEQKKKEIGKPVETLPPEKVVEYWNKRLEKKQ
jgi:hypothetical protein